MPRRVWLHSRTWTRAPYTDLWPLLFSLYFFFLVVSKFLSVSQAGLVAGVQSQKLLQALEGPPAGWVEEVIQVVGRALREHRR